MVGPLGLCRSIGLVSWPDEPGYQNEWPFGPEQEEKQSLFVEIQFIIRQIFVIDVFVRQFKST